MSCAVVNARTALAVGNAVRHTAGMVCFRTVWFGLVLSVAVGGCTVSESTYELGVWVAEGVSFEDDTLKVPESDVIGWSPADGALPVGRVSVIQIDENAELGFDPDSGSVSALDSAKFAVLATAVASVRHSSQTDDRSGICALTGGTNCEGAGAYSVKSLFVAIVPANETVPGGPYVLNVFGAHRQVGRAEFTVGSLGGVRWAPEREPISLGARERSLEVGAKAETPRGERLFVPVSLTVTVDDDGAPPEGAIRCVFGECAVLPLSVCAGSHKARFEFTVDAPPLGETKVSRDEDFAVTAAYGEIWGATEKDCD